MNRKFKIISHQTTALKEEFREKDSRLVRGHFEHKEAPKGGFTAHFEGGTSFYA